MINSQNCSTSFFQHDQSSIISLRHLMGTVAVMRLEGAERERLEGVRWLVKTVGKGRTIIDQGEDREFVSILLSGWAFRYQTLCDGKRQILDFVFDGTLIGFGSGKINSYGVETVTDCKVAYLSQLQFRRILTTCPSLAIQVAERVSDSEMRAHEHITSLGRRSARERISGLIVELSARTHSRANDLRGCSLALPVTQIMIGDALGLSNEHVCRVLGKLADDGVICFNRHTMQVLDNEALIREAGMNLEDYAFHRNELASAA